VAKLWILSLENVFEVQKKQNKKQAQNKITAGNKTICQNIFSLQSEYDHNDKYPSLTIAL